MCERTCMAQISVSPLSQFSITQFLQHSSRGSRSTTEKLTFSSGVFLYSSQRPCWHVGIVRYMEHEIQLNGSCHLLPEWQTGQLQPMQLRNWAGCRPGPKQHLAALCQL